MKSVFYRSKVLEAESAICKRTGISTLVLMENAGRSCAEFIAENFTPEETQGVVILAGKGNNAGDGFVIARHLAMKGLRVRIGMVFPESDLSGIALENFNVMKNGDSGNIEVVSCEISGDVSNILNESCTILIDGIFGIGLKSAPDERIAGIIKEVNSREKLIRIAIDVPSGLLDLHEQSKCINSDFTLTMGVRKLECMFDGGKQHSGRIHVMNIGVGEELFDEENHEKIFLTEAEDIDKGLLSREVTSNKYTNGKLLIIAGSPGLSGAAYLCAQSAIRTGCGAVIAAVPNSVFGIMEEKLTEVMKLPLADNTYGSISLSAYDQIRQKLEWADVVLLGPGISRNQETLELVRRIVIENQTVKFVIDADALHAFKGFSNLLRNKEAILTPHFGEFREIAELDAEQLRSNFIEEARNFSDKTGTTLVLKNAPSLVAYNGGIFINPTGKENLATAGSGDVLSGMIAAIWAKSGRKSESAVAGTYLHGLAGDILYDESGSSSTVAGDLTGKISEAKMLTGML